MTRKDYRKFADVLRDTYDFIQDGNYSIKEREKMKEAVDFLNIHLADIFSNDNPRFSYDYWDSYVSTGKEKVSK